MTETSKRRRALIATVALGIPVVALIVWPQLFGAERTIGIAQVVAFRAAVAIGLVVLAVIAGGITLLGRRHGILSGISGGLAIALLAASLGSGAVLVSRDAGGTDSDGELTVVAWNTQGGAASPEAIARLVRETDADIVSLPETDDDAAAEVVRLLARDGIRMTADTVGAEIPTSVLIAEDLGTYRHDRAAGSTPGLPSGVWRPDGDGPVIVAAHPLPPLPASMAEWRTGLAWATALCGESDVVIAGDLNATVDHLSDLLGHCRDAATEAGAAATGTWPTTAPAWLGAPIDHVLVGREWVVVGAEVVTSFDDARSDHRPIRADLSRRTG